MKIKPVVTIVIAILIITLIVYGCSKSKNNSQSSNGNTNAVNISGMAFPETTTVKKGATVTWTNKDGFAHTVTSDDGTSFNSGNLAGGATFSFVANTAGSFAYHCNYHSNMHGTLVVNP